MTSPPPARADWALFLDVDGSLVELAEHPDAARASPRLQAILQNLNTVLGGAVALVSGRSIAGLDALVGASGLAAAGLHGLERRGADGVWLQRAEPAAALEAVKNTLRTFVDRWPGTYLEDKQAALALHYRQAPRAAQAAEAAIRAQAETLGDGFKLIRGKCVFELRPRGMNKGKVVEQFLTAPPFAGRRPVFVGDDVTDEDGFAAVNRLGGISVRVGEPEHGQSQARYKINNVKETLQWLQQVAAALAAPANRPA